MVNSYKVPQDVEAEDKLIGPFSFRQFIYLGIVAMALAGCWGLFMLFPLLSVIPLPIAIFFGALALPIRKDQPMETYLAAMWQFYTRPRRRMWMADGIVSRISVDVPLVAERRLTKDITNDQAISQFDYLSQLADSGGWSSRGISRAPSAIAENPADDILDNSSEIAQSFDNRLQREDDERREELLARVHSGAIADDLTPQPQPMTPTMQPAMTAPSAPYTMPVYASAQPATAATSEPVPVYSPSPQFMQQRVIQPFDPSHQTATPIIPEPTVQIPVQNTPKPSTSVATPAIMELAKGVSVETVARQLHHEEVERHDDEVVINLH